MVTSHPPLNFFVELQTSDDKICIDILYAEIVAYILFKHLQLIEVHLKNSFIGPCFSSMINIFLNFQSNSC